MGSGIEGQVFMLARQELYQDQDLISEVMVSSRVIAPFNKFLWSE